MDCPNCQVDNRDDAKFCIKCGEKLELKCPQCAKLLPHSAKFCDGCGLDLGLPSEQSLEIPSNSERRKKGEHLDTSPLGYDEPLLPKTKFCVFLALFYIILTLYLLMYYLLPDSPLARITNISQTFWVNFLFLGVVFLVISLSLYGIIISFFWNLHKKGFLRPKIGKVLVQKGFISKDQLTEALSEQGQKIGEILVQSGAITPQQLKQTLDHQKRTNGKLCELLKDQGYLTDQEIHDALQKKGRKLGEILKQKGLLSDYDLDYIIERKPGEELYQKRITKEETLLNNNNLTEKLSKEVHYCRQAAVKANRLTQSQEAIKMLEQSQTRLLKLPENRIRQESLLDLKIEMLWPLYYSGQIPRMKEACQEAESVARVLGDRVSLGKALWGYGIYYLLKGEHKKVEPSCVQALEQLKETEEDSLIIAIRYLLAISYNSMGQWEKAGQLLLKNLRSQEEKKIQTDYLVTGLGVLPYAYCCALLGYTLTVQSRIKEAKVFFEKCHDPAMKRVSNLYTRTGCSVWHSRSSAIVDEDYGALSQAEENMKSSDEADPPILRFRSYMAKCNALMATGKFEIARVICEQALQIIEGITYRVGLAEVYFNLVQANLELGDREQAENYYTAAVPLFKSNPERITPRFAHLKGRILSTGPSPDFHQAEIFFSKSIKADEDCGALVLAAQTRFYLAKMLAQNGEVERSRSLFTQLCNQFQNWDIPTWKRKCEQALEAMDKDTEPS